MSFVFFSKTLLCRSIKLLLGIIFVLSVPPIVLIVLSAYLVRFMGWLRSWLRLDSTKEKAKTIVGAPAGNLSRLPAVLAASVTLISQSFLLYTYYRTTDIFEAIFIWPLLFLVSPISVLVVLYQFGIVRSVISNPIFSLTKWLVLITILWLSKAIYSSRISDIFYSEQNLFPSALSVGIFILALGFLSILVLLFLLVFEVLLLILFVGFKEKPLAPVVCVVLFIGLTVSVNVGRILLGPLGNFAVAQIAYEHDLLSYQACMGNSEDRKYRVLYLEGDQMRARVFSNPLAELSSEELLRPLRTLNTDDIKARMPKYEGVVTCEHRVFNGTRSDTNDLPEH
jgi:hypothetical protein